MYWRWVFSPIWIAILILYGEYSFKNHFLIGAVPVFLILTIIFIGPSRFSVGESIYCGQFYSCIVVSHWAILSKEDANARHGIL